MKQKNLILIGFMGSGKTSIGLKLSYRLHTPVEDTDKMIEAREGCAIKEIFSIRGEEVFRQMETNLLKELGERNYKRIYSVGGGTPVREENRTLLKQLGTVVYLRIQPETVYRRLKNDTTRPLLQCENPLDRIRELLESRKSAYESCADIIVDVDELNTDQVLDRIEKEMR